MAPYDPLDIDFAAMLSPFARALARHRRFRPRCALAGDLRRATALAVGFISSFLGSTLGALIGVTSAYFGGRIDMLDPTLHGYPAGLPHHRAGARRGRGLGKFPVGGLDLNLILAITIPIIPKVARVVRSTALGIRAMPYIDAARTAGYSQPYRHASYDSERGAPYLIMLTAFIAQAILLEASFVPRPWRHRADRRLGPDALRIVGAILPRSAVDDHFPRPSDQPGGVRLQHVRGQPARLSRSALPHLTYAPPQAMKTVLFPFDIKSLE